MGFAACRPETFIDVLVCVVPLQSIPMRRIAFHRTRPAPVVVGVNSMNDSCGRGPVPQSRQTGKAGRRLLLAGHRRHQPGKRAIATNSPSPTHKLCMCAAVAYSVHQLRALYRQPSTTVGAARINIIITIICHGLSGPLNKIFIVYYLDL